MKKTIKKSLLFLFNFRRLNKIETELSKFVKVKNYKNAEKIVNDYRYHIYRAILINKFFNSYLTPNHKIYRHSLRLKYNWSFLLLNDVDLFNDFLGDKIKRLILKILIKYRGYNNPIDLNIASSNLTEDEKKAINYFENQKNKQSIALFKDTANPDFDSKIKTYEKEISNSYKAYFQNRTNARYEDDRELNKEFNEQWDECRNIYINKIKFKKILNECEVVEKEKTLKNIKPERFKSFKKWITSIKFGLFEAKEKYYHNIILNMEKRLEILKYEDFKKNFSSLNEEQINSLYRAVKLNKKLINREKSLITKRTKETVYNNLDDKKPAIDMIKLKKEIDIRKKYKNK